MALLNNYAPAGTPCDTASALQGQTQVYKKSATINTRTYGTQPKRRTVCQGQHRDKIKLCVDLWKTLSSAQKTGWATLALATAFTNKCGQAYFLSTYNMFMKVNFVLVGFGASYLLSSAPAAYTPPAAGLTYTLQRDLFCYAGEKIATLEFTPSAGLGLQVFGLISITPLDSILLKNGYYQFSAVDAFDPLYGPAAGNPNPNSTRRKFQIALHLGWERVKSVYGGSCSPPPVA